MTDGGVTDGGRSYLDHNATAPLRPAAAEAMLRAAALAGNPSSVHAEGRAARAAVERAREQVARLASVAPARVVFTSGGTEAANTVLSPGTRRTDAAPERLLIAAIEHPCGLEGHRFPPQAVTRLPVDREGLVRLDALEEALAEGPAALVSVQAANNETGVVQPLAAVAALVRAHHGLLHADAVQAAGRLDLAELPADILTLSGHKIGGPKGAGAIVLRSEGVEIIDRLIRGGGQERGARAGTENLPAIAGFGAAAEAVLAGREAEVSRLAGLRDLLEAGLRARAADAVIFGSAAPRLPNTTAFAVPGLRAETALIALDLAGVAVSSGAACSSGKVRRSHVLDAMGVEPALAEGAIRVSLGWNSGESDVSRCLAAFETLLGSLYRRRADAA